MIPSTDREHVEAVIHVRIDNMATFRSEGSRSIRVRLKDGDGTIEELVAAALAEAPPVAEWQGF